jgi:hypothetical protein
MEMLESGVGGRVSVRSDGEEGREGTGLRVGVKRSGVDGVVRWPPKGDGEGGKPATEVVWPSEGCSWAKAGPSRSFPLVDRAPPIPKPARNELRRECEVGVPAAGDDDGEAIRARSGDGEWWGKPPLPPSPPGRVEDRCGVAGSKDDEPVGEDETEDERPGGDDIGRREVIFSAIA